MTYKGISSASFPGLYVRSVGRTAFPEADDRYLNVPGMDGAFFFKGNPHVRELTVECSLAADSFPELRQKLRDVAAWLYSADQDQLVFSDEPDKYYLGKVRGNIQVSQTEGMSIVDFDITFACQPFAYSELEVGEIIMDSDISVSTDLRVGDDYFVFTASPNYNGRINNFGTAPLAPQMTITGSFTSITVTIGTDQFTWNGGLTAGKQLVIDCEKQNVYTILNGVNTSALGNFSGSFPKLAVGDNALTIAVTGGGANATVDLSQLRAQYV